ncbi:MAG: hypothetical protein RL685_572 [Pseudomonadota bacterium]|jgi:hypothetical protein
MARSNLLDTRTAHLLDLIGNGRVYRVPPFQRDYSWNEEQWDDLWVDILELRDLSDERHYMGALVVEAKSDRQFLVIDGQQRLATLSVLVLAVIAKLQRLADAGTHPEENRERALAVRSRFIGEKDPASLVESSKLFLNETDDAFYQDYLVQLRSPRNARSLPRSNRLLWECFRYFSDRLDADPAWASDGESLAQIVTETVGRQLLFILITVDDELNAYMVFETLNDRGLELSTTDLLKNYLFSRVKVRADLEALGRRWKALVTTVKQERFPELLRYHLLCELPRVRGERLFKITRDRVQTAQDVFSLVDVLENRADLYAALSDANHTYWLDAPECRPHIRELQLFRVRQMTPLLFAAWERFPIGEFARVLKLVSTLSFRYSVVSGLNPNELESVYHDAARAVLDRSIATPRQVSDCLKPVLVENAKFEHDFGQLELSTRGQGKRLAKYILAKLEAEAAERACDFDTDPATIEHILPENPGDQWAATIPSEHWDRFTYRLGNLTLLEPSHNRNVGNRTYDEKVESYARSGYALTREIAGIAPEEWTIPLIEERQRRLAARASHVWRIDFT